MQATDEQSVNIEWLLAGGRCAQANGVAGGDGAYRYMRLEVSPGDPAYGCGIKKMQFLVGFDAYLEESAMLVSGGDGEAIGGVAGVDVIDVILVAGELVQELAGGSMQRKYSQQYDSQHLM